MKISYVCIKYLDDQIKYYFEPIESIFYKKNDKTHISPQDLCDFDKTHKYYGFKYSNFYPGYIVRLGGKFLINY